MGPESELRLGPGSSLTVLELMASGRIVAEGSPDQPVSIRGYADPYGVHGHLILGGVTDQPSTFRNLAMTGITLQAYDQHAVLLERVDARGGGFFLGAPGSRIRNSVMAGSDWGVHLQADGTRLEGTAVLRTRYSAGITITARDVTVEQCAVAKGDHHGIVVEESSGVTIHACNIENNKGPGVESTAAAPLDATGNWWGDALGPLGPAGDGVEGTVLFEPFLTAPALTGPPVARLTLHPTSASVEVADTVRFVAVAQDEAGNPLPAEQLLWRFSDTLVAGPDLDTTGVVTAYQPGEVTLTVVVRSDTTRGASATITVIGTGSAVKWAAIGSGARGLWASAADRLYAIGPTGLMRYGGTTWTIEWSEGELVAIHGRNGSDVYAVGGDVLLHNDGTGWAPQEPPPASILSDVWVSPGGELFISEDYERLWRRKDGGWEDITPAGHDMLALLGGTSEAEVYVRGWPTEGPTERVLRWDGQRWEVLSLPQFSDVWPTATGILGVAGGGVYGYDGHILEELDSMPGVDYWTVAASGSGAILAGGSGRSMRFYDGSRWTWSWAGERVLSYGIQGSWMTDGVIYVVDHSGQVLKGVY